MFGYLITNETGQAAADEPCGCQDRPSGGVTQHTQERTAREMLSYIGRSGQLAPAVKASAQAVANGSKNVLPGVVEGAAAPLVQPPTLALSAAAMAGRCATGPLRARAGVAGRSGECRAPRLPCWPGAARGWARGGAGGSWPPSADRRPPCWGRVVWYLLTILLMPAAEGPPGAWPLRGVHRDNFL